MWNKGVFVVWLLIPWVDTKGLNLSSTMEWDHFLQEGGVAIEAEAIHF